MSRQKQQPSGVRSTYGSRRWITPSQRRANCSNTPVAHISDEDVHAIVRAAVAGERERCAKIAENFSNAKPGDICEVMAGDFQKQIADAIRKFD